MNIPGRLDEWSVDVVQQLASEGRSETDLFDFKGDLPPAPNLTKACCAFANTRGGFLVFGVRERGSTGWQVEGLPLDREFAAKFGSRVRADPSIQHPPPRVLSLPGTDRAIFVVQIPRSPQRPHLPTSKDERVFWKRTNVGCEQMSIEEVRAEFGQYEERREKLKLLVVELATNLDVIAGYDRYRDRADFETISTSVLDRVLVDAYSLVQSEPDLLASLVEIQREARRSETRSRLLFARLAHSVDDSQHMRSLNEFTWRLWGEHARLRILCEGALDTLSRKFDLKRPPVQS